MPIEALPHVDEHATVVAASGEEVWRAVGDVLDGSFAGRAAAVYARLIGCADVRASGARPFAEGSTVPGFRVTEAVPDRLLTLEGAHRFSAYALTFRLDGAPGGGQRLSAETRAAFPGRAGALYRLLVIGTGAHARGVRRLLAGVRRRVE